ncbi:ABC transporter permease subunit [Paenibacillus sp. GCM10027626]|uniref:ABC transporter permease subunit n=1 Tax=Paenibacillus sp. GCM10027626 TaxID=3273411 RepID=UPI003642A4D9
MIRYRYIYLMLLPAVALVFLFHYYTLSGWLIAFTNYQVGISIWKSPWAGLEQFRSFFQQSSEYMYVIRNTLVMNLSVIFVNLIAGLTCAILIHELRSKRFGKFMQMISFFPFFISWVVVYSFLFSLFAASTGAVNETLVKAGVIQEGINLLGDERYSWILIICLQLWKYLGFNVIIFISSIASISNDQYEAADLDGAGRWGKVRYITVPNLVPTCVILLIMNVGWVLTSDFELFYLFINPTNWPTMNTLDMYIYNYGLQLGNFSYATAVGIVKTFVSLILVISANSISKKLTGKSIL